MSSWKARKDGAFIEVQHDPTTDYHQWWMPGDSDQNRDSAGRVVGGWTAHTWVRVRCNNFDCPAVGWVRADRIMAMLPPVPPSDRDG